jgi:hypothetical protein
MFSSFYKNSINFSWFEEKMTYMLVCTIYILVGLAFTSTIIELVRYVSAMLIRPVCTASHHD